MFFRAFCLSLSLFFLVSCGKKENEEGQKPIVVIMSPDYPPFEFKDTRRSGDQVIGFDVDLVQKIGEHLNRPIKIVEAEFSTLIPSLQSGRADIAMSGFTVTDERRRSVDFSDPYYTSKPALLVPENSNLMSEKELKNKKLGVLLGSSNEVLAHQWAKSIPDLSVISLNVGGDSVQALKSGRLQAVLMDEVVARKIVASIPGVKVVALNTSGADIAIAFPKGSSLVAPVNEALKKMKPDIDQLVTKWMAQ